MAKKKSLPTKPILQRPSDIELPINVPLPYGVICVLLETFEEKEKFWLDHREIYPYSFEDNRPSTIPFYLPKNHILFGPTKAAVMKVLMRFDQLGVRFEWYDYANDPNSDSARFYQDNEESKRKSVAEGTWSQKKEVDYQRCSPEYYSGWWTFINLPEDWHVASDFDIEDLQITDTSLSREKAEKIYFDTLFDRCAKNNNGGVNFFDADEMDDYLTGFKEEMLANQYLVM